MKLVYKYPAETTIRHPYIEGLDEMQKELYKFAGTKEYQSKFDAYIDFILNNGGNII